MMRMMKNPIILAICILFFSSVTELITEGILGPNLCCYKFYSKPLPKNKVVDFQYTDSLCPLKGVFFKMEKGTLFCADLSMPWVKAIIEAKEKELARKLAPTKGIDKVKEMAPTKEVDQAKEKAPTKEVDQVKGLTPTKEVDEAKGMTPTKEIDQEIYVQYCLRSI